LWLFPSEFPKAAFSGSPASAVPFSSTDHFLRGRPVAHVILVAGGSRSGKSDYARTRAEAIKGPRVFIATCPQVDEEMGERIRKHQLARRQANWHTVEEHVNICGALRASQAYDVFLVDCLTLWVNNLLYRAVGQGGTISEEYIVRKCNELEEVCSLLHGTFFFVTNEVGTGIVPEDSQSRLYRDLVGRCNQQVASWANEVVLVSCGLPLVLKSGKNV
jgi:adenosylcobinamide kinase / adenosylcobinamide-phosphate guanylyltransferase